ncbi:MAG: hydantoinase B/oxoprolinase family protein [Rudaea sp.]|uniref:hydantoinase B/oxoprolinase family protein n=1 Tax=Rudaea sp. TaxID=2136325 RepID=UPI0039E586D9
MNDMTTGLGVPLSAEDQKLIDQFLIENQLFYAPDEEIMRDHKLAPRSKAEEEVLSRSDLDSNKIALVRDRLGSALQESFNMVEQMGVAPGAKWGDLVSAVFTENGDLSQIGPYGIAPFASVCQYPVKFIRKYWMKDKSVGVRDGDGFIHNDSRYGNIHNTDQSMIMPLYYKGELVCWIGSTIHEGENGAIEPGGMPSIAESKFDEGLKMCPFKVVENNELKRDLVNFLQNSVRDPKLQLADMKVKLHAVIRLRERMIAIIEEFGKEYLIATLRKTLEDTSAEVRRRIEELPDGICRINTFIDGDLREHVLCKYPLKVIIKGDKMTWDLRGTSPELLNRSINSALASQKSCMLSNLVLYVWPDLPANQAILDPVDILTHRNTLSDSSLDAPNAMSLIPIFRALSVPNLVMAKFSYCLPKRYTAIVAAHYNQPATFVYGGMTQHLEVTGNFCADINGNGGGARENMDGEHSLSPVFGYFSDTGEFEIAEEELPYVRLVAQQFAKDRCGWGKYRGGMGYEQIMTVRGTDFFGFMTGQCGGKHNSALGLFGGYACPAYPLGKIKNINVFDTLKNDPAKVKFGMVELMNEQAIPGATYIMQDGGMNFEQCLEGEVYMICQGAGGGYGDVLDRDPALVVKDVQSNLVSIECAERIYKVILDARTFGIDMEATRKARAAEKAARKARGIPYDEFVAQWVTKEPPADLPYFGSWDDDEELYATPPGGTRIKLKGEECRGVMISNPKDRKIAALQAEIAELKKKTK